VVARELEKLSGELTGKSKFSSVIISVVDGNSAIPKNGSRLVAFAAEGERMMASILDAIKELAQGRSGRADAAVDTRHRTPPPCTYT
jgi:hypothetical protein